MYLITRSNLHPFRSCNRLLTTWVNGYTKGSFEERKIVIENNLLPLLKTPQPSQAIAQDLNKSVGGITAAMQLRTDIQKLSDTSISNASLSKLDECIQDWLSVVFCVDSLSLEHITFDSSGTTLERIARSDTVHAVRSISSLKKRLHNGRRCYALVHHALPNYPLAFIHVALTSQLANSMSSLDSLNDRVSPSHAMFYSVNSTSPAFRGLSLAPHLIKEVVRDLQLTCPGTRVFSTLSPIPNFMKWLNKLKPTGVLSEKHWNNIHTAVAALHLNTTAHINNDDIWQVLMNGLNNQPLEWSSNNDVQALLQEPLMWLAARYITTTRVSKSGQWGTIEPVGNFHMGNGAEFHRLNWMGNPSLAGLRSSAGMMVNYLYDLPALERNAVNFRNSYNSRDNDEQMSDNSSDGSTGSSDTSSNLAIGDDVRSILNNV